MLLLFPAKVLCTTVGPGGKGGPAPLKNPKPGRALGMQDVRVIERHILNRT
jgi:hypothetical protein